MNNILLSICIPSYNRPNELIRLLNSFTKYTDDKIEIVICEDCSPNRQNIRERVNSYKNDNPEINICYYENHTNFGYDKNLIELISRATGEYIMFMGDDDFLIGENLKKFITFIKSNPKVCYFLRRYLVVNDIGNREDFRYYSGNVFFEPSINSFLSLFRKSVFISGFTFKKSSIVDFYVTDKFNGTLLYQLYLCGELALNEVTAYCDIPITYMDIPSRGKPEFGASINESSIYTPGTISISNSINFMKAYKIVTDHFDKKYNADFTKLIERDLSKYSYPILAIQRNKGVWEFIKYCNLLNKEIRINTTFYYYVYFFSLLFLNTRICNSIIFSLKLFLGKTPKL